MSECNKQIQHICDYVDGELDKTLCQELEAHLKTCKNCQIMVDSLKQTVVLCREGKKETLPKELEERFQSALKLRWEKKFGKK